jgi:hypothetical protein
VDETISVEVGEDHLAAFRRSPKAAIAELIWNGLDADATQVSVDYELNPFDGVNAVIVSDNGTGMTAADARFGFRNFGNSWKRTATSTPGGRVIHGKLGRGPLHRICDRRASGVDIGRRRRRRPPPADRDRQRRGVA